MSDAHRKERRQRLRQHRQRQATHFRPKTETETGDAAFRQRYPFNADARFAARANWRAWNSAVQCSMVNNGTINAGMSTRGN